MTKKELGQHWLRDRDILREIVDEAELSFGDFVLEIGPGLGTLTAEILRRGVDVTAVEFDEDLARKLPGQFPGTRLTVEQADILDYDLTKLPRDYKVVANVPYYITSKIVQHLMTSDNPPLITVILVQKEVAQRIAAAPGEMSLLALSAQVYCEASLGVEVPRQYFTPPPEVDSQVVILKRRKQPLISSSDMSGFFRIARAGFGEKRKKLRSSLSGGLHIDKNKVDEVLAAANLDLGVRAQELSIEDWKNLMGRLV